MIGAEGKLGGRPDLFDEPVDIFDSIFDFIPIIIFDTVKIPWQIFEIGENRGEGAAGRVLKVALEEVGAVILSEVLDRDFVPFKLRISKFY